MNLFTNEPNPYQALERVLARTPRQQRSIMRLEVWCSANKCTPIRVFTVREGLLVQCRSDADVSDLLEENPHLEKWSRRRAFFLQEWLNDPSDPPSRLSVVCSCKQTEPVFVDVGAIASAVAGDSPRTVVRLRLPDVAFTS